MLFHLILNTNYLRKLKGVFISFFVDPNYNYANFHHDNKFKKKTEQLYLKNWLLLKSQLHSRRVFLSLYRTETGLLIYYLNEIQ